MKLKNTEEKNTEEKNTEEKNTEEKNTDVEEISVKEISAKEKLKTLLTCGNERVELSAAKEILAMEEREKAELKEAGDADIRLEVVIEVI